MPTHDDYTLFHGDCFEYLRGLPDASVDLVLTDPPYGCLKCDWDIKPDIPRFFQEAKRFLNETGTIAVFGKLPSSMDWIISGKDFLRYDVIWHKTCACDFPNANRKPLNQHETIYIYSFSKNEFHPQKYDTGRNEKPMVRKCAPDRYKGFSSIKRNQTIQDNSRLYKSVVQFSNFNGAGSDAGHFHPTQKPVPLLELLVKWYTSPGETVLDPFMGSGSTGVACVQTGRKFIGCELDPHFFDVAKNRLKTAVDNFQYNLFEETGENDG